MADLRVIARAVIWEDTGVDLMSRVTDAAAALLLQATTTSIEMRVFDQFSTTPTTAIATDLAVVVADTIFDTLQTSDDRWTFDTTGYNFKYRLAASALPESGRLYRVEFAITPTVGDVIKEPVFEVETKSLLTS